MYIEILAKGFEMTDAIRSHVERRLHFALGRFSGRIERVRVSLADVPGPRGGFDKSCRVHLRLGRRDHSSVVVEHLAADLCTAIDLAADRCSRTVTRRLDRRVTGPRAGSNRSGISS